MIGQIYNNVFFQPIFNLLIWLYDVVPGADIGIAIIVLTVLVKLALWPVSRKALESQKALADLQPKVAVLKEKHKDDQETLAKELMALYSAEKVSPTSSCLPLVIQLPIFIALYHALRDGLTSSGFEKLYPFVAVPEHIAPSLFGVIDLAGPNLPLAALAAVVQFVQAKQMVTRQQSRGTPGGKDEQMLAAMNRNMLYMMPAMTLFIGASLPGGLALYWLVMNLLTVAQQHLHFRKDGQKAAGSGEQVAAK